MATQMARKAAAVTASCAVLRLPSGKAKAFSRAAIPRASAAAEPGAASERAPAGPGDAPGLAVSGARTLSARTPVPVGNR